MVNSEAGSSSDAARAVGGQYQVFLNFRGPDTRYGFTDFLYHGLVDAGVRVFRDEDDLRVGEVIAGNLLHAINNSMIYIPIFSQNYASSKWCLRELAHIINMSQSEGKKSILPIFFHVKPEDVKLKTPLYSDALLEHEKLFPDEVGPWRNALAKVDEIKGWNVKEDQSQATIVKLVVKRVLEKLELKQKLVPEHLVGLDDRVKHLMELLDVNHGDVRLIGIYGMGGIGKTTVAKVIFNELSSHFGECCSFLENIREKMSTEDGIVQLQKKLLSDISDSGSAGVKDSEQGMQRIGEVLGTKKVLVVLDDADNKDHIRKLIGNNSLHSGSRIIITTRNKTILQGRECKGKIILYEMVKMDDAPALELFRRHAFGKNSPSDDYYWLSKKIALKTGGLPLAVEVIGSLLNGKDKAVWEETLIKLREVPEKEILEKLKISYDHLDECQQQIFLDIACFFFNEKKTDAIYMWTDCKFYLSIGIDVLTSRCLIKILDNDKFWMHDQLIDMGRQIVHQESPNDPNKRSRVWITKEAIQIIRTEGRKDKVQALQINFDSQVTITKEEFERFPNLRLLKVKSITFAGDFANCPSKLKYISMEGPLTAISRPDMRADNMYLEHLVVFKLVCNLFKDDSKVWDLIKRARALKVLFLNGCNGITRIPDFSGYLSLKRLTLAYCQHLKRIESFIGKLQSLIELEIEECRGLTDLPEEVGALGDLQRFSLQGCSTLRELPGSLGNLTSLKELGLFRTGIRELPNSIEKLKSLRVLHFAIGHREDYHAWHLPSGINKLVKLEELDLSRHKGLKGEIPDGIGGLSLLKILNLKSTGICRIPGTIDMLHCLQMLDLTDCHEIQELPKFPTSLTCLRIQSESLLSVPDLSYLTGLEELLLSNLRFAQENLKPLTGCKLRWIKSLSKLKQLGLGLPDVLAPLELAFLPHLEVLRLTGLDLRPLMQLLSSGHNWRCLLMGISDCEVEDIPLEGLARLEVLGISYCMRLQRLFIPLESQKLQKVTLYDCKELVEIQVADLLKSLEILGVYGCISLTRISGLQYLKNLKKLNIQDGHVLTNVEGLDELESLESLRVERCTSLGRFIDASCTKIPDNCLVYIKSCGNYIIDFDNILGRPLKLYKELILQGKRQRDDDHASPTDTTTKNSTCGQRSGIPQHVTRRTTRQVAKIQPLVEEAALPVEEVGPSRKRKRNDSKQPNPIRRSARLMKGATGGTADVVHID